MQEIWDKQKEFNDKFFSSKGKDINNLSMDDKQVYTKDFILHLIKEATEVLDEIKWKMHRNENEKKVIESNLLEEIIDVFKYAMGLCQIWGIGLDQFRSEFKRKSDVVEKRFAMEYDLSLIDQQSKKCVIDVDDVLADSTPYWLDFVNKIYNTNYKNFKEARCLMDKKDYLSSKHEFRISGQKLSIPAKENAVYLVRLLNSAGYKVIILSSRPYEKYHRIYADTLTWLNNNKFEFDALFFDNRKHEKILNKFKHIDFMIEDRVEIALSIADFGSFVYLIDNNNEYANIIHPNIKVVKDLKQLIEELKIARRI